MQKPFWLFLSLSLCWAQTQVVTTPIQQNVTNPNAANNPNDHVGYQINCTFDGNDTTNPNYSDQNCLEINQTNSMGQALYGSGTNAKKTTIPLSVMLNSPGSGQRIGAQFTINCYGMSDCAKESSAVTFGNGPIAGDEGQGFNVISYLRQQGSLARTTVTAVSRNMCAASVQVAVVASSAVQTITVDNTAGCAGWVVLGHAAASSLPNAEAVNVTIASGTMLTGVFLANHPVGTLVLPATVLTLTNPSKFGQDRVLVNLSQPRYSTGIVASIVGGGFTGSGTTWTAGMVGGDVTNPGCISLANDTYTGAPFTVALPLVSWYEIGSIASATQFGIYKTSVAGDAAYHGNGVGAGAYSIAPCSRVLNLPDKFTAVLDWGTFTWAMGDSVEEIITPYPDVTGFQYQMATYTPGGSYRGFTNVVNSGNRMFGYGISFNSLSPCCNGNVAWDAPFTSGTLVNTAFRSGPCMKGCFTAPNPIAGQDNAIHIGTASFASNLNVDGSGTYGAQMGYLGTAMFSVGIDPYIGGNTFAARLSGNNTPGLIVDNLNGPGSHAADAYLKIVSYGDTLFIHPNDHSTFEPSALWRGFVVNVDSGSHPSDVFAFGQTQAGWLQSGTATAAKNFPSSDALVQASVWNGATPQNRWGKWTVVPRVGTNGLLDWNFALLCAPYNLTAPCQPFSFGETGTVTFGYFPSASGAAADHRVTLDPTGLTAARRITVPDASGTLALQSPVTASGTTCTITAITNGIITGATCQ